MNRLTRPQKDKITQFRSILGASEKVAFDCLKAQGWSLEAAIDLFYASGLIGATPGGGADAKAIEALFLQYKDADGDLIGVDGIGRLCEDLEVDPADIAVLVLAYHLDAAIMCEFTRQEFTGGLARLGVDSVAKLKARLPELRAQVGDAERFREIYNYAFLFARERGQKCLQLETALAMWRLVFAGPNEWPMLDEWCSFLQEHHNRALSKDTWAQLLDFVRTISPDFSNFDESAAWPYLLDEFVEYARARRAAGGAA